MFHKQIVIIDNKEIAAGYFVMELISSQIAQNSFPGQFLHIKCSSDSQPLLRRPLSIHRVIDKKTIEILYKVVGKGTHYLSERKKGGEIDCLGPLGNGFELPKTENPLRNSMEFQGPKSRKSFRFLGGKPKTEILLVAGGIGIAPLFFLIERITKTDNLLRNSMEFQGPKSRKSFRFLGGKPITVFIGAKTKDEILCANELKSLGVELHIATEDGSMGYKGLVSDLLKNNLSSVICHLSSVVYACGPKAMLKEIALISKKHQIPCQVSFEQFMGCGIGICNACVIKTKHGYRRVCKDGPVFKSEEIDWNKI